jgi:L-rhamnonate dehydratase
MRITAIRTTVVQERALWAREVENPVTFRSSEPRPAQPSRPLPAPGSLLVEVEADGELVGIGLGGGGWPGGYVVDHYLAPLLLGRDPMEIEELWQAMYHATLRYGQAGIVLMAISGVDLALWDLKGRALDKPVWALFGDRVRESLPVYATNRDPLWAKRIGCFGVKFGAPYGPADGPEGLRKNEAFAAIARERVGPDMALMIDCSSRWDVPYTIEMARILAPYDLYFIEEPVPPYDIEGYATLRRRIGTTRIVGGEHAYTRHAARQLLEREAVDVLQPDIRWTGGLSDVLAICDLAEGCGIPVMPHRGGMAHSLHLMVTRHNCPLAEGMCLSEEEAALSLFEGEPLPVAGELRPSAAPGFGLSVRPEALERLRLPFGCG